MSVCPRDGNMHNVNFLRLFGNFLFSVVVVVVATAKKLVCSQEKDVPECERSQSQFYELETFWFMHSGNKMPRWCSSTDCVSVWCDVPFELILLDAKEQFLDGKFETSIWNWNRNHSNDSVAGWLRLESISKSQPSSRLIRVNRNKANVRLSIGKQATQQIYFHKIPRLHAGKCNVWGPRPDHATISCIIHTRTHFAILFIFIEIVKVRS